MGGSLSAVRAPWVQSRGKHRSTSRWAGIKDGNSEEHTAIKWASLEHLSIPSLSVLANNSASVAKSSHMEQKFLCPLESPAFPSRMSTELVAVHNLFTDTEYNANFNLQTAIAWVCSVAAVLFP